MKMKDMIRNGVIRGTAKFAKLGDKLSNGRSIWYRYVTRRGEEYLCGYWGVGREGDRSGGGRKP